MFIAHLPAGYIVSRLCFPLITARDADFKAFMWAGMFGAITPDLDILYFYFFDHRQHHHHTFWPHFPIVWTGLLVISYAWLRKGCVTNRAALAFIFSLNGFIHICLDSIVGGIWWLAPFVDMPFAIFTIPSQYTPWWLNFALHWTFLLELSIILWALYLLRRKNQFTGLLKPFHAPISRSRILYLLATVYVVVLGLSSRQTPELFPQFFGRYPGDSLWALMVFLGWLACCRAFLLCDSAPMHSPFRLSSRVRSFIRQYG